MYVLGAPPLSIDIANVQTGLYNFWKERVLLRSFQ